MPEKTSSAVKMCNVSLNRRPVIVGHVAKVMFTVIVIVMIRQTLAEQQTYKYNSNFQDSSH